MTQAGVYAKKVHRFQKGEMLCEPDLLAVEAPLEIRLIYGPADRREEVAWTLTMRSPGQEEELILGLIWAEGIIRDPYELPHIRPCVRPNYPEEAGNVFKVSLPPQVPLDWKRLQRNLTMHAGCGVCGKTTIDALRVQVPTPLSDFRPRFSPEIIYPLPTILRGRQTLFAHTGGLHAAALVDSKGKLILIREDVGRHNAMDKLIGAALLRGLFPLHTHLVAWSGRASFELVQKALMAGLPLAAAIGAPSTLAVNLAEAFQLSLIGFVRKDRFNLYCGLERLILPPDIHPHAKNSS